MTTMSSTPWGQVSGLSGKTVVVFGVSNGIGSAVASALSSAGANVACVDVNSGVAENAAAAVDERGATAEAFTADVTDRLQVREVLAAVAEKYGAIHGCADIVGASLLTPVVDGDDDAWRVSLDLNLNQAFIVAGEVLPYLRDSHGSLVFTSSVSALTSMPNKAAYGAAKAGLISLTKTLAVENGEYGVRVNAVAPGVTLTPPIKMRDAGPAGDEVRRIIPMGRGGETEEIANVVVFLTSALASYVSGQVLAADGAVTSRYALPVTNAGFSSGKAIREYYSKSSEDRDSMLATRARMPQK